MRASVCASIAIGLVGCSSPTPPGQGGNFHPVTAPVTFVVHGIVPEVWRVDVTVNGSEMEPIVGTFETAATDRVMIRVPLGDGLNAFARGFEGTETILYIGETYFDVKDASAMEIEIELNYKGPHFPAPN